MSALYFITGNSGKYAEVKALLGEVEQLDIDLPELQELDPHKIIQAKLQAAFEHHDGEFIVEDTSLSIDALQGLPGTLVKWFLQTVGFQGIFEMTRALNGGPAQARTLIGYAKNPQEIQYFEGVVRGKIVSPRGAGMGWDPIFQPDGSSKTYGEMTKEEKNQVSMRRRAVEQLHQYLSQ